MNREDLQPETVRLLALTDDAAELEEASVENAWRRFCLRRAGAPRARRFWALRPAWLAASAGLALVGVLGFSPAVRSATVHVLSLFRATQVEALPIPASANAPIHNHAITSRIGQLLSDEVTVTLNEKNRAAADAAEASQWAGFPARYTPVWNGAVPTFQERGAMSFQMKVNLPRAQALLSAAGVAGPVLPASLNGASIAVHIPRALTVAYGDCTAWSARALDAHLPPPLLNRSCTVLGEVPSPVVHFPAGLNMRDIADVGLQLLGMSPAQARQYTRTVDWSSTLVVPFPEGQAASRQVAVDGVRGVLFLRHSPAASAHYELLWSRQGMLYSISGAGGGAQGLALARLLAVSH